MSRVIILGMDGATFDVLLPRAGRGELPNLSAVLERGASGSLRSTTPPFSAQAWVSMVTGKNQARHGVTDFWEPAAGLAPDQRRSFVTSRQVHGETLWQTANRHGLSVAVVNVPVTYPPAAVTGVLVSGFLTPPGREDFCTPPELRAEIESLVPGYQPDPFDPLGATRQQLDELYSWMEKHEVVARALLERHPADLHFSVVQALDHLQHLFWDEIAAGNKAVDRFYLLADAILGRRLAEVDDDTTLFVVSDHGFGPARTWFHVNRFLQDRGLLVLGEVRGHGPGSLLARLGLTPQRLRGLVRRLDVLGVRRRMGRLARVTMGRQIDGALARPIDWSQTQAAAGSPASEGIWINLKGRDPEGIVEPGEDYEALRTRIAAELLALRDPQSGGSIVHAVYRREELYAGPFLDWLPDLVFDLGDGPYLASDAPLAARVLEPLPRDVLQGRHRPLGVLLACGAGIRPGYHVEGARIVDITPTVLYALGLPIPDDVDGRPLVELFDAAFQAAHPIQTAPAVLSAARDAAAGSDEDTAEMERRLRGLGYLS